MAQRGVRIVFCPSYWIKEDAGKVGLKWDPNAEVKSVNALCTARAFENNIVIVYCNAAGTLDYKNGHFNLLGQSQVTTPFQGCVKRLDHNKEGMFIYKVDLDVLRDAEKVYRIRLDLKKRIL